ncbi:MAG: nucleotidyltransferase domain-containing protein [bacterium]
MGILYISGMEAKLRQKLITCLLDYFGENLVSAVFFGSRARGEAKTDSDYDIFLVAEDLPKRPFDRNRYIRKALFLKFDYRISIHAKTTEEFERGFPPLYLDLGLDGQVLYDTKNYLTNKLARIREIIDAAGLVRVERNGYHAWEWKKQPARGWSVTWEGFYDGSR